MNEITFGYSPDKLILKNVNFDIGFETRIAIVGANGAGKSTLYVKTSWLPLVLKPVQYQNSDGRAQPRFWPCHPKWPPTRVSLRPCELTHLRVIMHPL